MLKLKGQRALLAHVNLRGEKHGEDTVPAIDLKVEIEAANDILERIALGLTAALYCDGDPTPNGELIERPLAKLRFPGLGAITTAIDLPGYRVSIGHGLDPAAIVLSQVKLNKVTLEPQEGGTVKLGARLQCAPESDELIGELARKIGQTIEITLEPPEALE